MGLQISEFIAEEIAVKIGWEIYSVVIVFSDDTEIRVTNFDYDIRTNFQERYKELIFYINFNVSESKTVTEIKFYDRYDRIAVLRDELSVVLPAGDIMLIEVIKISYQL